ncbi:MAG: hypothetical protein M0T76_05450 [Desulfobacteraceae bacterium]|nr:hypothetical protein [Desulfobacteraceae bacterium]
MSARPGPEDLQVGRPAPGRHPKAGLLLCLLAALLTVLPASQAAGDGQRLVVIYSSDVHGQTAPCG